MIEFIGVFFLIAGFVFVYSGSTHRRRVLRQREEAIAKGLSTEPPQLHASLEIIAEVVPSLVIVLLSIMAASVAFAFFVLRASHPFSLFDLAAVLFALAGYGFWLMAKTRFRALGSRDSASYARQHGLSA